MQYNVSSLLKELTGATRTDEIDDDLHVEGATHHITGHARLDRTHDGILVRAQFRGTKQDDCSRCLKAVEYPVDVELEEEFITTVDVVTGARTHPPEGEEDAYRINERHILDLEEAAGQYWLIALPMAPLCRDDCPGLCPLCGEEISSSDHPCGRDSIDSRWEQLAKLQL